MKVLERGGGKMAGVVGMGASGAAAARLLVSMGYVVRGFDSSPEAVAPSGMEELIVGDASAEKLQGLEFLVLSPGVPPSASICSAAENAGLQLVTEVELAWAASRADAVAVTGSNGKTTTVEWTGHVLSHAPGVDQAVVAGNVGYAFSDAVLENPGCTVFALELSSYQLQMIDDLRPACAAFLNLTPDHLARHGTMEEYGRAKARIFMNQTPEDTSILNADDPLLKPYRETVQGRLMEFSTAAPVNHGAWLDENGYLTLSLDGVSQRVIHRDALPIPGMHNVANALAVICLCSSYGVDAQTLADTIPSFRGVPHRIETLGQAAGLDWINDSKSTNVDSLRVALQSFPSGVVLLAGGLRKESDYSVLNELIREKVSLAILFGSGAEDLDRAWSKAVRTMIVKDLELAVESAVANASPGSTVLLSPGCASFDQYRNFEERGEHFRRIVGGLS